MRASKLACFAALLVLSAQAQTAERPKAFPTAEGFNVENITGGRGGEVRKVTNLDDSGLGSFREAVKGNEPKIVIFEVSGIIRNKSGVRIGSNTTVAGQTSPAGITFYNWERPIPRNDRLDKTVGNGILSFGSNVIVRHIRSRGSAFKGDPFSGWMVRNVILDHVSVSWGGDQSGCFWQGCKDITIQWCTFEEAVGFWHGEGGHNYGPMIGFDSGAEPSGNYAFHHNLMAHHLKRNPELQIGVELMGDIRNNVSYDAGDIGIIVARGRPCSGRYNIVGNFRKAGPSTETHRPELQKGCVGLNLSKHDTDLRPMMYVKDNKSVDRNEELLAIDHVGGWHRDGVGKPILVERLVPGPGITTHSADEAYKLVLEKAGAWPRDATTRRTVEEVKAGTGGWVMMIPDQMMPNQWVGTWAKRQYPHPYKRFFKDDANDWPNPPAPKDSDDDGMPDTWETAHGLDPASDDHNGTTLSKAGYTNLEVYIHELAESSIGKVVDNLPYQYKGKDYVHPATADEP